MPKVYETTSLVQLGSIDQLVLDKEEAKEILLSQSNLLRIANDLNLKIKLEDFKRRIKIEDIANTNLLKIKTQFSNPDTARKINEALPVILFSYGGGLYQKKIALINERLDELEQEIHNADNDIKRTRKLVMGLSESATSIVQSDISLRIILLQNTIPNYEVQLTTLKNQKNATKMILIKASDFRVLDSPVEPKYYIKPKKTQNIVIAAGAGLMLSLFIAFLLEYLPSFWNIGKN
jgi:capsular polysaccharide biosynthesis protein